MSNRVIDDTHWKVDILNPMSLRSAGWTVVDKAWLLEGDRSFLDHDLMWGGTAYPGISVKGFAQQPENLYRASFSYTGAGSANNMTLWNVPATGTPTTRFGVENQDLTESSRRFLPIILTLMGGTVLTPMLFIKHSLRKKH